MRRLSPDFTKKTFLITIVAIILVAAWAWAVQATPPLQAAQSRNSSASDPQLQRRVRRLLRDDPATRAFAVGTKVQSGRVTLAGQTYSSQAREAAAQMVARLPGVMAVQNQIVVEPNADLQVAQKLHAALSKDPAVDDAAIAVTVIHRKIFLSGSVASAEQRDRAAQVALSMPGIVSVSNGLEVLAGRQTGPRPPVASRAYLGYRAPSR